MTPEYLTVLVIQPRIQPSLEEAYEHVENLIGEHAKDIHPDIIVLPERWTPLILDGDLKINVEPERGKTFQFTRDLARRMGALIISGGIWEARSGASRPVITTYIHDAAGQTLGRQDKIHLYTYEKEIFQAGNTIKLFSCKGVKFAALICFDMTFWETPRMAVENGADILFSPTMIREEGLYNWKIYLQARSLENRVPVVACNTLGQIMDRKFLGESTIVQFERSPHVTPSKIKIESLPSNKPIVKLLQIDVKFPRKLRENRLNEVIHLDDLRIEDV